MTAEPSPVHPLGVPDEEDPGRAAEPNPIEPLGQPDPAEPDGLPPPPESGLAAGVECCDGERA